MAWLDLLFLLVPCGAIITQFHVKKKFTTTNRFRRYARWNRRVVSGEASLESAVVALWGAGQKVDALRLHVEHTNVGLRHSREAVKSIVFASPRAGDTATHAITL